MSMQMKRTLRWAVLPLGLISVAFGSYAWSLKQPSEISPSSSVATVAGPSAAKPTAARIEAVQVRRADLSLRAEASGYLEPWRKVEIRSEVPGQVVQRTVEEGSSIAAGGLLVLLDDRERRIELEEAQAELLKSQAAYTVSYEIQAPARAERSTAPLAGAALADEVRRVERLVQEGLLSQRDLIEARRRYEADRLLSGARQTEVRAVSSGLVQAEQRLERSRLALERTRIAAPFAGRIADLAVEAGQQISPGDALMTLLQDIRLKVDVDVLEADIVHIRRGAPARVRIPSAGGMALEGSVYTINPRIDPETGTGRVTVAIPNPRRLLLTGLFASVELETDRLPDRLVIPESALLVRQGRDLVFRVEHGRALWTYVQVGRRSADLVEIVDGLALGDVVGTAGHFALAHEAPVEAVLPPNSKSAALP